MTRAQQIYLYGGLFGGAVSCFYVSQLLGRSLGVVTDVLAIAGGATCGWSWLLVRALFRTPKMQQSAWPLAVVMVLVGAMAFLRFNTTGALPRMADNVATLVSSTVLLLAAIEPLRGLYQGLPTGERRFRLIFAGSYATVLTICQVWVNGSPAGSATAQWGSVIKVTCAVLALTGMTAAIWYRTGNPMPEAERKRRAPVAGEDDLGERILRLMAEDGIMTASDLKVADLARRVGEADYKVTRCITGALGFRNFNHMVNHFRIAQAKVQLADPQYDHLPVLTIALDCGFGSIGPFNRAFKAEVKVTPSQFREKRRCAGDIDMDISLPLRS